MLTFGIKEVDPPSQSVKDPHVDEYPGRVVLDVARVFGAVVGVVPLVRGQQQLHEHVGDVGVVEGLVMAGVHGDAGQGLENQAEQVLQYTTET